MSSTNKSTVENQSSLVAGQAAIAANPMLSDALSGNALIAEFMGLHFHKVGWVDNYHIDGNYESDELKYNYSWDWLMPVVEKIESIWISGSKTLCTIRGTFVEIVHSVSYHNVDYAKNSDLKKDNQIGGACYPNKFTKIENTFRMVVEFIKWYNQQGVSEGIR